MLYTALGRPAAQGLVARDGEEAADGRLPRHYRLTSAGLAAAALPRRASAPAADPDHG